VDREWDGLIAHREYPMVSLDNYPDDAVMPMSASAAVSPLVRAVPSPRSAA
jgi:hypothetical protein